MGSVLSGNGLMVPDDFPANQFEAVYKKVQAHNPRREYALAISAMHAISYRFMAIAEYDGRFTASLAAHGPGPGQPIRYEQERDLFGFFTNAFSVLDAFCFAMYAIGALTGTSDFQLATARDERNVTWGSMRAAYGRAFPNDPIISVLGNIANDKAFTELREARNVLTHRAAPPRTFGLHVSSMDVPETAIISWINISLDPATTSTRRQEITHLLCSGLASAQNFVQARL
jgi:hypothetical protein